MNKEKIQAAVDLLGRLIGEEYFGTSYFEEYMTICEDADRELAASMATQAPVREVPEPVNWECRRYCKGDGDWTGWASCNLSYYEHNKTDASFEFRLAAPVQQEGGNG